MSQTTNAVKQAGAERRDFDKEAAQWDANAFRVNMARDVSAAMIREVQPTKAMKVLDFGCGTGLITLAIQPLVKEITGADSSTGMLETLNGKIAEQKLDNIHTEHVDFEKGQRLSGSYDLIVSSMVTHHVPDTFDLFREWHKLLQPGGRVAFADLDTEDGSFHGDNTGVFHLGFDRGHLRGLLEQAGFTDIRDTTATVVKKELEGKGLREFSIFLITARRD
ncbi:MAG TPA: class I SAM-dependent methyltransferase [Gallionellaceae bacterium]|nr:class I SAM-dependent methyltransferase [Gallionellaceae bacterium]